MRIAVATLTLLLLQDATKSKDPEVRRVTLKIVNAPLTAIIDQLREETGIPIDLDEKVRKQINGEDSIISIEVKDTTVLATLQMICLPRNLKAVSVEKKKVVITTP